MRTSSSSMSAAGPKSSKQTTMVCTSRAAVRSSHRPVVEPQSVVGGEQLAEAVGLLGGLADRLVEVAVELGDAALAGPRAQVAGFDLNTEGDAVDHAEEVGLDEITLLGGCRRRREVDLRVGRAGRPVLQLSPRRPPAVQQPGDGLGDQRPWGLEGCAQLRGPPDRGTRHRAERPWQGDRGRHGPRSR